MDGETDMTIEERADAYCKERFTPYEYMKPITESLAKACYIDGATEQKALDAIELPQRFRKVLNRQKQGLIDKACEIYENELRQMKRILNEVKDGAGELISVDGSLIQFRKAMEE